MSSIISQSCRSVRVRPRPKAAAALAVAVLGFLPPRTAQSFSGSLSYSHSPLTNHPAVFSGHTNTHTISQHCRYHCRSISTTTALLARGRNNSNGRSNKNTRNSNQSTMRGVKKENLPQKVCVTCHRPFTWRKKWEKCWDEVTTCSKSCNRKRREKMRKDNSTCTTSSQNRGEQDGTTVEEEEVDDDNVAEDIGYRQEQTVDEMISAAMNLEDEHISPDGRADMTEIQTMGQQLDLLDLDGINALSETHANANSDDDESTSDTPEPNPIMDANARRKAERKAAKKARKAARRAERQGLGDPSAGQKRCDRCSTMSDLLVRCRYKDSKTEWQLICGKCWTYASGGVVDGDAEHPDYQYGGLWKNRRKQQQA